MSTAQWIVLVVVTIFDVALFAAAWWLARESRALLDECEEKLAEVHDLTSYRRNGGAK